jgi:hypothetical protein
VVFKRKVRGNKHTQNPKETADASRKGGMWTGGPTPDGYKRVDKQLKVDPTAAALVGPVPRLSSPSGGLSPFVDFQTTGFGNG